MRGTGGEGTRENPNRLILLERALGKVSREESLRSVSLGTDAYGASDRWASKEEGGGRDLEGDVDSCGVKLDGEDKILGSQDCLGPL